MTGSIADEDFDPYADTNVKGWPMAVTISHDISKAIGWNVSTAQAEDSSERRIEWVKKVDKESLDDNLTVDCVSWWYGE